jgi:hypothetical protein
MSPLPPPYTDPDHVEAALRRDGYAIVHPGALASWLPQGPAGLQALQPAWDDLPPDTYLRDGGRYRRRRHSCFVVEGPRVAAVPHRAHWQPLEYNALHGGLERWFSPMQPQVVEAPVWSALLRRLGALCSAAAPDGPRWYVEAHQFRIDTSDGIGRPTPEGAHRARTATASTSSPSCWSRGTPSRAARRACSRPTARAACVSC